MGCRTEKDLVKTVEVQSDGLENWLLETHTEKELAIDSPGDKAGTPQRGENSARLRSFPVSGFLTGLFPLNNFSPCFTLLGNCQGSYRDCFLLSLTVCYLLGGAFSVFDLQWAWGRQAFVI